MAAAVDLSWLPVSGRHPVTVGPSLGRTLKSRKGGPPPKNNKVPNVDFFSLRYNFQPESIDPSKPGTIEVKRGKDSTSVAVERACTQNENGGHIFVGTEQAAKEWDCVLVYDHETGTFTLEKLDSYVNLTYDRRADHAPRQTGSPIPPAPPGRLSASTSTSTQSSGRPNAQAIAEDPSLEDAEGDIDEEFEQLLSTSSAKTNGASRSSAAASKVEIKATPMPNFGKIKKEVPEKEEGEASEGEIVEEKPRPAPRVLPPGRAKPAPVVLRTPAKPSAAVKPSAKSRAPQPPSNPTPPAPKPPPVAALPSAANGNKKRALEPEVEELDLPPPAKRARTPPSSKSSGLALPGAAPLSLPSSTPVGLSFPGTSDAAVSLPPPAPALPAAESDEEDEWDEVPTAAAAADPASILPPTRRIMMEEIVPESTRPVEEPEEEDDAWSAFEAEMNRVGSADREMDVDADADGDGAGVEEEEDFLLAAVSENQQYEDTDDDDTSSDDSDDD